MNGEEIEVVECIECPAEEIDLDEDNSSEIPANESSEDVYNRYMVDHGVIRSTSGHAIASLVMGIVGFFVLGIILGTLAIIFGGIGLYRIHDEPNYYTGRGLAIAGIILGIIGIPIKLFLLLIYLSG